MSSQTLYNLIINFCILRGLRESEIKYEKRQKGQGLDVLDLFPIPLSATSCTLLPLHKGDKNVYLYYSVRFSRFIDSPLNYLVFEGT